MITMPKFVRSLGISLISSSAWQLYRFSLRKTVVGAISPPFSLGLPMVTKFYFSRYESQNTTPVNAMIFFIPLRRCFFSFEVRKELGCSLSHPATLFALPFLLSVLSVCETYLPLSVPLRLSCQFSMGFELFRVISQLDYVEGGAIQQRRRPHALFLPSFPLLTTDTFSFRSLSVFFPQLLPLQSKQGRIFPMSTASPPPV